ncbi:hypothetical protein ACFL2U_00455 [Patescibacteria group bacterium]
MKTFLKNDPSIGKKAKGGKRVNLTGTNDVEVSIDQKKVTFHTKGYDVVAFSLTKRELEKILAKMAEV